jgi:hypothetical protein
LIVDRHIRETQTKREREREDLWSSKIHIANCTDELKAGPCRRLLEGPLSM